MMPIPLVTRILIADDFTLVREGLKKVLDAKADLEVVAEAADGAEAVDKALRGDVDLAVLDVSMPRMLISLVLVVAYAVAVWAMTGKPN